MSQLPFWQVKSLLEMAREEWESLCDGCARCCLLKLEDEETGELFYTNVVCRLMDADTCRCTRYEERSTLVPDCVTLSRDNVGALPWMPSTCAYRLLQEGQPLPEWHPLVSGDSETVHTAGVSVRAYAVTEDQLDNLEEELEEHIIEWLK